VALPCPPPSRSIHFAVAPDVVARGSKDSLRFNVKASLAETNLDKKIATQGPQLRNHV
jgi:hypothetical protein